MDPKLQTSITTATTFRFKDLMFAVLPSFLLGGAVAVAATRLAGACGSCTNCSNCSQCSGGCSGACSDITHPCRLTGIDSDRLALVSNPGELASLKAAVRAALTQIEQKEGRLIQP